VAEFTDPSSFSEYMKRVSHVIALQGIFGILLLATRFLPDESPALVTLAGGTLTLLGLNSLAVFALFLVLTIAIFRQEADGPLGDGDPFRRVVERYGRPSGSTTLFRVVHAIFSLVTIIVYLTAVPAGTPAPTPLQVAGIIVLFVIVVFSSPAVSLATSRLAERTIGGARRTFACLIYLLGLGLNLGGADAGMENLLIAGMVIISLGILYVVIQEDRRIRAGESARET
jgi:hypothetical protein